MRNVRLVLSIQSNLSVATYCPLHLCSFSINNMSTGKRQSTKRHRIHNEGPPDSWVAPPKYPIECNTHPQVTWAQSCAARSLQAQRPTTWMAPTHTTWMTQMSPPCAAYTTQPPWAAPAAQVDFYQPYGIPFPPAMPGCFVYYFLPPPRPEEFMHVFPFVDARLKRILNRAILNAAEALREGHYVTS
ncbi:hypothetical protein BD626DRAFT_488107 [Schizophyllum amplum]|uniref:Uncharacterized protein n=1 Tax=Schizophyllum amplum TaxID=97359 RepID=A0A550CKB8_9AGAR|nr:hypothetical protein BD626DRAFT_488107 [Auriculariopsis ampla]